MMHAASLTDEALTVELARLAGREREATAADIVHGAEFDAPTTVRLLAPHLTAENHTVLLAEAAGKGKQDVEVLLAHWFPQPDVAASVRKVPSGVMTVPDKAIEASAAATTGVSPAPATMTTIAVASNGASRTAFIRPLAPERYEVRFTADAETRALLKEAQDLLGRAVPAGDLATIFRRALTVLVADLRRRKFGATARPRPARTSKTTSGNAPAAVRRGVCGRDANRCAFVST